MKVDLNEHELKILISMLRQNRDQRKGHLIWKLREALTKYYSKYPDIPGYKDQIHSFMRHG